MKNKAPTRQHSDFIESASVTALMRALLSEKDNSNPDYLAKYFVSPNWQHFLVNINKSIEDLLVRVPGCMHYHLVRTKQFDESLLHWIKNNNSGQIIILGSGLDSRSIRFYDHLHNFKVYELDLKSMLEYKEKVILEKINKKHKSIFIPINFGTENLLDILKQNSIPKHSPTFILWEGVSYFLNKETVVDLFNNIKNYFIKDCTIVFDYAYKQYIDGNLNFFGATELNRELKNIGEPHIFGIDPDNILTFAKELNWNLINNYKAIDLEKKFLDNSLRVHGFHGIAEFRN
ncbi:class I SAM-dependent methyltransferase [Muribacter muris]|nr:SAM-dependent methyltransferase [Muribacter muris]MBF0786033.1 class I SAM-dependent methyltransferase [Muribacter muris]MBF0826789.1 class I SAM-dependent methyltransferase [Muribacter muris]